MNNICSNSNKDIKDIPEILKSEWFSINNDGDGIDIYGNQHNEDNEDNEEKNCLYSSLQKRIEDCENINKSILQSLEDINKKLENLSKDDQEIKQQIKDIQKKVLSNESTCNVIRNENLKLINRILEAEISVERTTNILLRKNISFPFTKLNL